MFSSVFDYILHCSPKTIQMFIDMAKVGNLRDEFELALFAILELAND